MKRFRAVPYFCVSSLSGESFIIIAKAKIIFQITYILLPCARRTIPLTIMIVTMIILAAVRKFWR